MTAFGVSVRRGWVTGMLDLQIDNAVDEIVHQVV
jgi:hypothetical protein